MAMSCAICGKAPMYGNSISHAHNVTKRRFLPNLQSVHAVIDGKVRRVKVCTRCLKSGKVVKAPKRQIPATAKKVAASA